MQSEEPLLEMILPVRLRGMTIKAEAILEKAESGLSNGFKTICCPANTENFVFLMRSMKRTWLASLLDPALPSRRSSKGYSTKLKP